MVQIQRTTEYALTAMVYMRKKADRFKLGQPGGVTTAREIALYYGFPQEMTAKILQKLKAKGFVTSLQGVKGGYLLARGLNEISLAEFIEAIEGNQHVVDCWSKGECGEFAESELHKGTCAYEAKCEIRPFMGRFQSRIQRVFDDTTLEELMENPAKTTEVERVTNAI